MSMDIAGQRLISLILYDSIMFQFGHDLERIYSYEQVTDQRPLIDCDPGTPRAVLPNCGTHSFYVNESAVSAI